MAGSTPRPGGPPSAAAGGSSEQPGQKGGTPSSLDWDSSGGYTGWDDRERGWDWRGISMIAALVLSSAWAARALFQGLSGRAASPSGPPPQEPAKAHEYTVVDGRDGPLQPEDLFRETVASEWARSPAAAADGQEEAAGREWQPRNQQYRAEESASWDSELTPEETGPGEAVNGHSDVQTGEDELSEVSLSSQHAMGQGGDAAADSSSGLKGQAGPTGASEGPREEVIQQEDSREPDPHAGDLDASPSAEPTQGGRGLIPGLQRLRDYLPGSESELQGKEGGMGRDPKQDEAAAGPPEQASRHGEGSADGQDGRLNPSQGSSGGESSTVSIVESPDTAVDPSTLDLPKDKTLQSYRERAAVAMAAATAASEASNRAAAYAAAATSASSKAAEAAALACMAARAAQDGMTSTSEEALAEAESRAEAMAQAARKAEERAATLAGITSAYQDMATTQKDIAQQAAHIPTESTEDHPREASWLASKLDWWRMSPLWAKVMSAVEPVSKAANVVWQYIASAITWLMSPLKALVAWMAKALQGGS